MILFALLALLADGMVSVPPTQWQAIDVPVQQPGTTIFCSFEVLEGSRVQALLLDRKQAERFHRGRRYEAFHVTGFDEGGRFRFPVERAGDYVLIIDNRIDRDSTARVRVRLELLPATEVHTLTAERRQLVVSLSLLFFGSVVLFSARQYLKHQSI